MTRERRDEGSILPMVLVLMVISSLIVLPLLGYTIAVYNSNTVVTNRTAQAEAAKGGLRMALADPKNVFLTCDGGGNLTPSNNVINGISVQTTCTEISEVGPAAALGYEVPAGAVAMQLGAEVPVDLSGLPVSSGPAYPYPASPDWWATPAPPDPGAQYSREPIENLVWMADLPLIPSSDRSSTPFDMPAAYGCKVFFPGHYTAPVTLTGRMYFTSGVYYFEEPVTLAADADVVVGYGLEDFSPASDCADDLQVASNVLGDPGTYDISGGGATWVFGGDGRLVIDNTSMTSGAKLRFNQRYDSLDKGGRVSIMTVNGDDAASADHSVDLVNRIPRSEMLNDIYVVPIDGTGYVPSSSEFTDKARLPEDPDPLDVEDVHFPGSDSDRGAIVATWDEVTGQDAGGSLLGAKDASDVWTQAPYEVQYRRRPGGSWTDTCPADEQVVAPKPTPTDGNVVSCVITGLTVGDDYQVRVRTVNGVGTSVWNTGPRKTIDFTEPVVGLAAAPSNIAVAAGVADDVAQITWDTPAIDGGLPVLGYEVNASLVSLVPHANVAPIAPVAGDERLEVEVPATTDVTVSQHVRAYDPNGDELTLTITVLAGSLPAGITASANDVDDTVDFTVGPSAPTGSYGVQYAVTDPSGEVATGEMWLDVVGPASAVPHDPIATPASLLADVGLPITTRLPVADPNGVPLGTIPVTVDATALDADWNVTVSGIDVTITTTAPDGNYVIPYTVTDSSGATASSTIDVTIVRDVQPAGTCTVTADPGVAIVNACEIALPDATGGTPTAGPQGYYFEVTTLNAVGVSDPDTAPGPLVVGFDGGGSELPPVPPRLVEPWMPEAIIDIDASGVAPVELLVAGYVAVPMGRLHVDNPNGHPLAINGGVMAGTFDIVDSRADGNADSVPIGFKNDIVLQRKVRIVSVAKNVTSTAVVELNEDGADFAINQWVVG